MIADDPHKGIDHRRIGDLHGHRCKVRTYSGIGPGQWILRCLPAQFVDGRCCVGNAGKDIDRSVIVSNTHYIAILRCNDIGGNRIFCVGGDDCTDRRTAQIEDACCTGQKHDPAEKAHTASGQSSVENRESRCEQNIYEPSIQRIVVEFQKQKGQ